MWLRASLSNLPLIICASLAFPPCESSVCMGPPTLPLPFFHFPGSTALHSATISCQPQCVKVLLQVRAISDTTPVKGRRGPGDALLCLVLTSNIWSNVPLSFPIRELVITYSLVRQHLFNTCYVQTPCLMLPLRACRKAALPGTDCQSVNMHVLSSATGRGTAETNCCDDGLVEGWQRCSH